MSKKFGKLTVIKIDKTSKCGHVLWLCLCDCGKKKKVFQNNLVRGHTRSCGCLRSENSKKQKNNLKHGMWKSPEYIIWLGMRQRCSNINARDFSSYGGRGIKVCAHWDNFVNFFKDMGPRPTPEHSIDRIDNNGDYTPKNCRWATNIQQQNNKKRNVILKHKGSAKTISMWARHVGMREGLLHQRIYRGWSVRRALTTPKLK